MNKPTICRGGLSFLVAEGEISSWTGMHQRGAGRLPKIPNQGSQENQHLLVDVRRGGKNSKLGGEFNHSATISKKVKCFPTTTTIWQNAVTCRKSTAEGPETNGADFIWPWAHLQVNGSTSTTGAHWQVPPNGNLGCEICSPAKSK